MLGTAVAFLPALAISTLSWFALERPALRWTARRDRRVAAREARLRRRDVDRGAGGREVGGREIGGTEVGTVRA